MGDYSGMPEKQTSLLPFALSGICGVIVCLVITFMTEAKVAWESSLYYWVGIPVMCLVIFTVSFFFPKEPLRWPLAMWGGQFVSVLFLGRSLALFPLVLVYLAVCSVPQICFGLLGAKLSKRMT